MKKERLILFEKILKFVSWILLLLAGLAVLGLLATWLWPSLLENLFQAFPEGWKIELEGLSIDASSLTWNRTGFLPFVRILLAEILAAVAFTLAGIRLIEELVRCIQEERPFIRKTIECLNRLAWLSLIYILAAPALNGLARFMFLRQIDFSPLLASGLDYSVHFSYVLEIGQLIIPACLFALCAAFRQGQKLQEFSDSAV